RIIKIMETRNEAGNRIDSITLDTVLSTLRDRMHQDSAEVTADGKWYFSKPSPHTRLSGIAHADVKYSLETGESGTIRKQLGMTAMVTTLCPCSKEISEYSAHNQRGYVKVLLDIDPEKELPDDHKEQLYEVLEINAS